MIKEVLEENEKGNLDDALRLFLKDRPSNSFNEDPLDEYGRYKKLSLYNDFAIKYALSSLMED